HAPSSAITIPSPVPGRFTTQTLRIAPPPRAARPNSHEYLHESLKRPSPEISWPGALHCLLDLMPGPSFNPPQCTGALRRCTACLRPASVVPVVTRLRYDSFFPGTTRSRWSRLAAPIRQNPYGAARKFKAWSLERGSSLSPGPLMAVSA